MDLVNEQDDVARCLYLAQQTLDPLLELTAELGARHKAGEVQQKNFLIPQTDGHLSLGNALGNALGDGGLAHTGFTDKAGVILLAAAQNLDGAVNFAVAPDDIIQLALPRLAGQVFAVGIQKLALGRLFAVFAVGLFFAVLLLRAGKAQREGGIAAGYKILVHVLRIGILAAAGHIHQHGKRVGVAQLLHHALHAVFHVIQILFRHPELFHQIVHGFDVQFPGTVQTVPFLLHLTILHPLDKDDRRTLLASNTDHSSSLSPLLQKRVEHIKRFIVKTAAHYSVVKHIQVAAGDDHKAPHHAQHEV